MKLENNLDNKYKSKIENITFKPIFILGVPRSGTTILYKILGETKKFNVVTAYHVLNYDQLLFNYKKKLVEKRKKQLNTLMADKGITNRKMDKIKVTVDYTQEYANIFTEKNYPPKITKENKWLFDKFCKKVQYISENNKSILVKNPPDYPNFLFLKEIYPTAKFIFIHRNPLFSISSMMRALNFVLTQRNEYTALFSKHYENTFNNPILHHLLRMYYSLRFPAGIFEIIKTYRKSSEYFLKNINKLSNKNFISIKYEDLCDNPNYIIRNIMDFLELKVDIDFTKYIAPRNLKIVPIVKFLQAYIYKKMESYFKYFGYVL